MSILETYLRKLLGIMKRTGRLPKLYFVREGIWYQIRDSFQYPLSDADCCYRNILLCGVPICIVKTE